TPASAQRAIELDDRCELLALQRGQIELAAKQASLRVEDLQIAVETSSIAVGRQTRGVAERSDELLLLGTLLAGFAITSECVRDLAERAVDGSLVVHDQLAL